MYECRFSFVLFHFYFQLRYSSIRFLCHGQHQIFTFKCNVIFVDFVRMCTLHSNIAVFTLSNYCCHYFSPSFSSSSLLLCFDEANHLTKNIVSYGHTKWCKCIGFFFYLLTVYHFPIDHLKMRFVDLNNCIGSRNKENTNAHFPLHIHTLLTTK